MAANSVATAATQTSAPAGTELTDPFTEMVRQASAFIFDIVGANTPFDLRWDRLLITLFLACCLFLFYRGRGGRGADGRERENKGLLAYLLPKDIYTHVSAKVDLGLWVLERILRPLWAVSLFATVGPFTAQITIDVFLSLFDASPALEINYAWMLLYSLFSLLCYDFVFYVIHYTMHKVPALWAIHKIHHSAEVLTPLTRGREHFIAGPIWAAGSAMSYGFAAGVFTYFFDGSIVVATLFNVSFFSFILGLNGAFRHYHIQFHYPHWLAKWIQSPAMHHTHHSYLPQHWDTNMAAVTSIYDRLFGTLYIPEKNEFTPWGIGPNTQHEYRSFWQNVIGPFKDWYKMIRGGSSPQNGAAAQSGNS